MQYEVIRALPLGGRTIPAGEIIDGSEWPEANRRALISQRYVQPVMPPMVGVEPTQTAKAPATVSAVAGERRQRRTTRGQE